MALKQNFNEVISITICLVRSESNSIEDITWLRRSVQKFIESII